MASSPQINGQRQGYADGEQDSSSGSEYEEVIHSENHIPSAPEAVTNTNPQRAQQGSQHNINSQPQQGPAYQQFNMPQGSQAQPNVPHGYQHAPQVPQHNASAFLPYQSLGLHYPTHGNQFNPTVSGSYQSPAFNSATGPSPQTGGNPFSMYSMSQTLPQQNMPVPAQNLSSAHAQPNLSPLQQQTATSGQANYVNGYPSHNQQSVTVGQPPFGQQPLQPQYRPPGQERYPGPGSQIPPYGYQNTPGGQFLYPRNPFPMQPGPGMHQHYNMYPYPFAYQVSQPAPHGVPGADSLLDTLLEMKTADMIRRKINFVIADEDDVPSESEEDTEMTKKKLRKKVKSTKGNGKSSKSSEKRGSPDKKSKSRRNAGSDDDNKHKRPSKKDSKQSRKPQTAYRKKRIAIVKSLRDISTPFGKYDKLSRHDDKYKMVSKYIRASVNVPDVYNAVKIHQIVEFNPSSSSSTPSPSQKPSKGKSTRKLLFWKTTPGSVKRLAEKRDGVIAFYDRAERALALPPAEIAKPLKQIILLCSVNLGKQQKSPHGYGYWAKKDFGGNDSIVGVGSKIPDPARHELDDTTVVPCGKTIKNTKFKNYNQAYNEYMIYESRRAKIRYAVEVEIIPPQDSSEEDSETTDSD